jgi:serine-type D-Ala-D-Ala endopeptidase (penicillin-binding protein 7)
MQRRILAIFICAIALIAPELANAAPGPYLRSLYAKRADLQELFDAKTYLSKKGAATAAMSLEDWARQYGWREDKKLDFYKPKAKIPQPIDSAPAPTVSASAYVVIDQASGLILSEQNAGAAHRIASLTKLMTVEVALSKKVPMSRVQPITAADQVGGSRLGVAAGTKLTVSDLLYATLLPSANDAANALADSTRLSRAKFVAAMNATAKALGLNRTVFAEPTGIDDNNVSTAREFALVADKVFKSATARRYAQTASRILRLIPSGKKIAVKNSDTLLTAPQYDDVLVAGGKTGYLGGENGWNLAVVLKSAKGSARPLVIVIFGEPKMATSMADAHALAQWAWAHYKW